jgi:hypothetical protein
MGLLGERREETGVGWRQAHVEGMLLSVTLLFDRKRLQLLWASVTTCAAPFPASCHPPDTGWTRCA